MNRATIYGLLSAAVTVKVRYDNAAAWRDLVRSKVSVISGSMSIPLDDLRWYGAYHDMGHYPHIHLMVYSKNPKKAFSKSRALRKCGAP